MQKENKITIHLPFTLKEWLEKQTKVNITLWEDREGAKAWVLDKPKEHFHPFTELIYNTLFETAECIASKKVKRERLKLVFRVPNDFENDDLEAESDRGIEDEEEKVYC